MLIFAGKSSRKKWCWKFWTNLCFSVFPCLCPRPWRPEAAILSKSWEAGCFQRIHDLLISRECKTSQDCQLIKFCKSPQNRLVLFQHSYCPGCLITPSAILNLSSLVVRVFHASWFHILRKEDSSKTSKTNSRIVTLTVLSKVGGHWKAPIFIFPTLNDSFELRHVALPSASSPTSLVQPSATTWAPKIGGPKTNGQRRPTCRWTSEFGSQHWSGARSTRYGPSCLVQTEKFWSGRSHLTSFDTFRCLEAKSTTNFWSTRCAWIISRSTSSSCTWCTFYWWMSRAD